VAHAKHVFVAAGVLLPSANALTVSSFSILPHKQLKSLLKSHYILHIMSPVTGKKMRLSWVLLHE
jgi:hypothetical protein